MFLTEMSHFIMSVWCYASGSKIYNLFLMFKEKNNRESCVEDKVSKDGKWSFLSTLLTNADIISDIDVNKVFIDVRMKRISPNVLGKFISELAKSRVDWFTTDFFVAR